ncbi:class I adenylate-forming enzyme family protein [Gordonia sp. KTR9]|uniref:class I adenylate-forming enzyme family protein n=1 Tax=Gordonia sp. KTR9 TaxID=337191 RepID=UPI00027DD958|nr:class I adenylate-forming enzyme family protein [Gordonia sp. KTR9]AFR46882.1 Acyl-CoA synthetases (AMP-forming)/AMP-acid ligases II [Gordonia sp. KTR9]
MTTSQQGRHEGDQAEGTSISSALSAGARRRPHRVAIETEGVEWTYRDLDTAVDNAAISLHRAGIEAGDRVGIVLDSTPAYVIHQIALARLGAAFVAPNPSWTPHEVRTALRTAGATAAIVDDAHRDHPGNEITLLPVDDTIVPGATPGDEAGPPKVVVNSSGELFIPFSSGTTGFPKGVVHTVGSVSGAVEQLVQHTGLGPDDRMQISIPLCHIFGTTMMFAALSVGARVTLFRRFDFDECIAQLRTGAVTVWPLAGTVAHRLARQPDLGPDQFPALRFFMWGGSPVPADLAATITSKTGVGFLCSYGMTEAMMVAFNPVDDPGQWRLDSPGFPTAGTEVRLGEDGELEVRGPSVAVAYTHLDAGSDSPFTDDGWFRTGDVARIDQTNRIWIVDRKKDMIKVSGFQVAPAEVESELLRHPEITDAAVVAEPDDRTGQRIVAYVVAAGALDTDRLRQSMSTRLATYKMPSEVRTITAIPRHSSGKLQRGRLRDAGVRSATSR